MHGAYALAALLAAAAAAERLPLNDFRSPPPAYRTRHRYWLPDASVDIDAVVSDIKSLAEAGGGGIQFLPFYNFGFNFQPTLLPAAAWDAYAFGTPAFKEVFLAALNATEQNGLAFTFFIGASQGQGVPSEPSTPGLAVHLVYGATTVSGGEAFEGALPVDDPAEVNFHLSDIGAFMHPHEKFEPRELVAVVAAGVVSSTATGVSGDGDEFFTVAVNESSLVDLTEHVNDGGLSLNWTAPGDFDNYTVFAIYERYTNQRAVDPYSDAQDMIANGSWFTDHFSAVGAQRVIDFWEENILDGQAKQLLKYAGEHSLEDSVETSSALFWSHGFVERFKRIHGYSPVKYIPLLFNQVHSYRAEYAPYDKTYVLNQNDAPAETYHLPVDMSESAAIVAAPELESLAFPSTDHALQFAGGVLINGGNLISSEIGADFPAYSVTVNDLVHLFKLGFAGGVNSMAIHGMSYGGEYANTTWPGYTPAAFFMGEGWNDRYPDWTYLNDSLGFAARNQLVLQTGKIQRDVAFYLYKNPWSATEEYGGADLRNAGFSYEYLGPSNLASPEVYVSNGILAADGPAYRALVLNQQSYITSEAAQAVLGFARRGLPIVIIGDPPSIAIGSTGQEVVSDFVRTLQSETFSNVKFVDAKDSLPDTLRALGAEPRLSIPPDTPASGLWSVWRKTVDTDFVYLYNANESAKFEFSLKGLEERTSYQLDAWTGEQRPLQVYQHTDSALTLSVSLSANQTTILAFAAPCDEAPKLAHAIEYSENVHAVEAPSTSSNISDTSLLAYIQGTASATIILSNGAQIDIPPPKADYDSKPIQLGPWDLTIESFVPSDNPEITRSVIETTELGKQQSLRPWSEIEGLQNVSGVGIHTTTFTASSYLFHVSCPNENENKSENESTTDQPHLGIEGFDILLTFPTPLSTIRVWINGVLLPPVDISDPSVYIGKYLHPGENKITVHVSTTLFNAVKVRIGKLVSGSDTPLTPDAYTGEDVGLQEYGLVGVVLEKVVRVVKVDV